MPEDESTLTPVDLALEAFARKSTLDLRSVDAADIERLRAVGLDDRAIHDAVQVIAYFNYINRVASCLGVPDEPDWPSAL